MANNYTFCVVKIFKAYLIHVCLCVHLCVCVHVYTFMNSSLHVCKCECVNRNKLPKECNSAQARQNCDVSTIIL